MGHECSPESSPDAPGRIIQPCPGLHPGYAIAAPLPLTGGEPGREGLLESSELPEPPSPQASPSKRERQPSGHRAAEEVLGETLQHAAGLVHVDFCRGIQATGNWH